MGTRYLDYYRTTVFTHVPLSFAVDIKNFKPDTEINNRDEIFVYFKSRSQHEMNLLEKALKIQNVNYKIFSYLQKYQENDYQIH